MSENKSLHVDMDLDGASEPRDVTKWVWLAVIVLFVAMGAVLYLYSGLNPQVSVVRIRHILISFDKADPASRAQALERIRGLRERIQKGEDFGKLARDNSNDATTASKGGDLGYYPKGSFENAVETFAWSAPVDQLSDVLTTSFGFHLVEVVDRRFSKVDALAQERALRQVQRDASAPVANP
ncbi:MAG: hypothetical protein FJY92_03015 [Candidatus Hydrogenedentes bacterium]|nr:hypothetical protein [Candidatus Hydrogenedentota bacterium]